MNRIRPCGLWLLTLAWSLAACAPEPPAEQQTDTDDAEAVDLPDPGSGESTVLREGFTTPESAVYDAEQDVYFVSNINGRPMTKDDNGYISRIDAGTGEVTPRFIDGAREDITLNGPCGLAIVGDRLWAADIDTVRAFDRHTGAELEVVAVPDTLFLNDLYAADDGTLYASDLGLGGATEGTGDAAGDAVYRISPDGRAERIAHGNALLRPDGLWWADGALWVASFGSNEVYRLVDGHKQDVQTLPAGVLDGLMFLADGSFIVSSWDGNGLYRGRPGGPYTKIVDGLNSPADFGLDTRRGRLVIPQLDQNRVTIAPLPPMP